VEIGGLGDGGNNDIAVGVEVEVKGEGEGVVLTSTKVGKRCRQLQVDLLLNMDRYRLESEESW
jgi:hypothetical protein